MTPPAPLKAFLNAAAFAPAAPFILGFHLVRALGGSDEAIQGFSQAMSLVPGRVGVFCRRAFYRATLDRCDMQTTVGFGTLFATSQASLGAGTYIGEFCNLGHVAIGKDVLFGSNVTVLSGNRQHHFDRTDIPIRHQGRTMETVHIGDDAWLGNGAIVMADVGEHAIVAAGAVVTKPVAPFSIVGGNPARLIRMRDEANAPVEATV
jgi:acetyltransferase-like isoleucine patch superfamily enzyme